MVEDRIFKKCRSALTTIGRNFFRPLYQVTGVFRRALARQDLPALLAAADPKASFEIRKRWLESLMQWVRSTSSLPHEFDENKGGIHHVRIRFILHLLERQPEWKRNVGQTLQSILSETSLLELFCSTGLVEETGFFSEIGHRLASRIFPVPPREKDFSEIFLRMFSDPSDAGWVEGLPSSIIESLSELITFQASNPKHMREHLTQAMVDARIILGANAFSISLTTELRKRLPLPRISGSPFYRLEETLKEEQSTRGGQSAIERAEECREQINHVFSELEESGVSVTLVHRLEQQLNFLRRIETLTVLLNSREPQPTLLKKFIADLIREHHDNRMVGSLVKRNLHLLSRKIVERTGASGEHYITTTRKEYFSLWRAAAGGGFITVFTAFFKLSISSTGFPLFFEGLFAGINYAVSFILLQLFHFTLATKQPSVTAAALAGKLLDAEDPRRSDQFAVEVSRIHRSQFISILGNIIAVVPGCILFDLLMYQLTGGHLIREKTAHYVLHSLHPFQTLTIFYSAVTGVILWLSSIIAGWGENWVVYRKIPEAIAEHRLLILFLGKQRSKKMAKWFLNNISGLCGNTSLGFLLSFTPIIGRFFGVPLDVRHITLSAGSLAIACSALYPHGLELSEALWAVAGLVAIGIVNVTVAFTLALLVAAEAREISRTTLIKLLKTVGKKLKEETSRFFWPSASEK